MIETTALFPIKAAAFALFVTVFVGYAPRAFDVLNVVLLLAVVGVLCWRSVTYH